MMKMKLYHLSCRTVSAMNGTAGVPVRTTSTSNTTEKQSGQSVPVTPLLDMYFGTRRMDAMCPLHRYCTSNLVES